MRIAPKLGPLTLAGLAMIVAQGIAAQHVSNPQATTYPEWDRLHDEAMEVAYGGDLEAATWMHGNVAYGRPADDARRFACLRIQADLLHVNGYLEASLLYMNEAAQQAEAEHDPYNAAMTYIDAGLVAVEAGDRWAAVGFASRARELASYSSLNREQRAEILGRLDTDWRN